MHNKDEYTIRVDKQTGIDFVSATLMSLLESLSDDSRFKLPSITLGNIITSAVTNQPIPFRVGLGITLGKKSLIQQFHDLGICCSYDEVLRFKASAAAAASSKTQLTGIQSSSIGMVQAIADNFDAKIASPNGLKSTNALALPMTQVCPNTEDSQEDSKIKRLKKENLKDSIKPGIPVSYYHGPKSVTCQKKFQRNLSFLSECWRSK